MKIPTQSSQMQAFLALGETLLTEAKSHTIYTYDSSTHTDTEFTICTEMWTLHVFFYKVPVEEVKTLIFFFQRPLWIINFSNITAQSCQRKQLMAIFKHFMLWNKNTFISAECRCILFILSWYSHIVSRVTMDKIIQWKWEMYEIKTQRALSMCEFDFHSGVFSSFEWQVSAATSSESKLGQCSRSSWVTSGAPLWCSAGSVNCYLFGGGGWGSGSRGGGTWHGKVTSNPGIKEPRQYWGSCASGPHTVIHQIRTSSSTSLYRLDSGSIPACLEWLTITCAIWEVDVWHIENFSSCLTPLLIVLIILTMLV